MAAPLKDAAVGKTVDDSMCAAKSIANRAFVPEVRLIVFDFDDSVCLISILCEMLMSGIFLLWDADLGVCVLCAMLIWMCVLCHADVRVCVLSEADLGVLRVVFVAVTSGLRCC
eukprot:3120500-Rhodomonas_salina.1